MRQSIIKNGDEIAEAKALLENGSSIVFFDTETTGFSRKADRILSFSAIKAKYENGFFTEEGRINQFINPGFHIPEAASAVNHITDETVADCPDEKTAAAVIFDFLAGDPIICGYNSISFDEKFMDEMSRRNFGVPYKPRLHLDAYKMAKEKLPGLSSHKLGVVAHELGCDMGIEFHNSLDDVMATLRVFQILLSLYEEEEQAPANLTRLRVRGASYWDGPKAKDGDGNVISRPFSHKMRRIYVKTSPYIQKLYFDIYRNEWVSSDNTIDLRQLKDDLFRMYKVSDEKELVKVLKSAD